MASQASGDAYPIGPGEPVEPTVTDENAETTSSSVSEPKRVELPPPIGWKEAMQTGWTGAPKLRQLVQWA